MTHPYFSTACHHKLHDRCRARCKWCRAECTCTCHESEERKAS